MTFTKNRPTEKDVGKFFWVRFQHEDTICIRLKEVRLDKYGQLYLSGECDTGWTRQSIGTPLAHYTPAYHSFLELKEIPDEIKQSRL